MSTGTGVWQIRVWVYSKNGMGVRTSVQQILYWNTYSNLVKQCCTLAERTVKRIYGMLCSHASHLWDIHRRVNIAALLCSCIFCYTHDGTFSHESLHMINVAAIVYSFGFHGLNVCMLFTTRLDNLIWGCSALNISLGHFSTFIHVCLQLTWQHVSMRDAPLGCDWCAEGCGMWYDSWYVRGIH